MNAVAHRRDLYAIEPLPPNFGGWFRPDCEDGLSKAIERISPRMIIELGSWKGKSSIAIAGMMPKGCHLYCVDTWKGSKEHQTPAHQKDLENLYRQFLSNVIACDLQDRVTPIRATTREAFEMLRASDQHPDLVFVDASHEYDDVRQDVHEYWSILRPGGVLCGDDLDWPGVADAVLEFAREKGLSTEGCGRYFWAFEKEAA